PQVILPSIRDTDNPELKYQYLYDAYVKLRKELSYLLGNLDSDNVLEAQSVVADWVYAGSVTTDQLIAGEAKIGTALIEDLVVGGNVAMGANATISWSQVTNQPSIPSISDISSIATTITANYVATPNLITNIGRVNDTLHIGNISSSGAKAIIFKDNASIDSPYGNDSLRLGALGGVYIQDLNITGNGKLNGSHLVTLSVLVDAMAAHVAAYHS
ncbi:MAG TPA: hypothetical protein GXZ29_04040, partial [Clostridiales bacterium]|nr:hypothetical protein [Clostridiales bacterium]